MEKLKPLYTVGRNEKNGAIKNSMEVSQNIKNRTTTWSRNLPSGYLSKRIEIRISKRYEHSNTQCSPAGGNGNPPSILLAWRVPRTEGPVGLQSMGSHRARQDAAHTAHYSVRHCSQKPSFTHNLKDNAFCTSGIYSAFKKKAILGIPWQSIG